MFCKDYSVLFQSYFNMLSRFDSYRVFSLNFYVFCRNSTQNVVQLSQIFISLIDFQVTAWCELIDVQVIAYKCRISIDLDFQEPSLIEIFVRLSTNNWILIFECPRIFNIFNNIVIPSVEIFSSVQNSDLKKHSLHHPESHAHFITSSRKA